MILKPPTNISKRPFNRLSVFLAGSIEMGVAEDWQTRTGKIFDDLGWNVFNPRRDDWDASWTQEYENPQFYQQVNWELDALEQARTILMYFDPNTKSPISLLELGLFINKDIHVVCPNGFWRKGNVDIVCQRHKIPIYETLDLAVNFILENY
jgi:hypothetical protein